MDNIYVLYNVDANVHKSTNILNSAEKYLAEKAIEHKTLVSRSREEARQFVHDLEASGGGKLIIIGGDGTIHNAVNAIRDFSIIKTGFIKGGSANDLATTLRINDDPVLALKDILENEEGAMNLIDVGGVKCVNVAATGLDVEVLKRRDKMKLFYGKLKYLLATVITVLKFGSYRLTTVADGKTSENDALLIAVGNGKYFGGGMQAVPHAFPNLDKFAWTLVHNISKIKRPALLSNFMKGNHEKCHGVIESLSATEISVLAPDEKDFTIDIDGELYTGIPFDCKLLKNALKVILPKEVL